MSKKIIFSTGGTGGHIFPALNLMNHFSEKGHEVLIVTDKKGKAFIKDSSEFKSYILNTETFTNTSIVKKFLSLFIILFAIIKSIIILRKERPDIIFGFGGYVSFPISFASRFFKLPLILYENNIIIGRANKYLSSFSKKILLAKSLKKELPEKINKKTNLVGSILNKKIINFDNSKNQKNKIIFSILVLGGSQGAEFFGKIIPPIIKKIKELGYKIEIKQQCLANQKATLLDFYNKNDIKNYIFEFDNDIIKLASSSNLAITRCGASTTAELVHTLTPFIGIPLPNSIDNHQYLNAEYYENKGCCWVVGQDSSSTENLFNLILEIIKDENKLKNIENNMKNNSSKNVYGNIDNALEDFI